MTLRREEIYWIEFPPSVAREQAGRRSAIIIQTETPGSLPTVFVVPLTTNAHASRYPGTFTVEPSETNGLQVRSVVLAFQLRAIDRTRVGERLGSLEPKDLTALEGHLRSLLSL